MRGPDRSGSRNTIGPAGAIEGGEGESHGDQRDELELVIPSVVYYDSANNPSRSQPASHFQKPSTTSQLELLYWVGRWSTPKQDIVYRV